MTRWIADVTGCRKVTVRRGLRGGGSPWLIDADGRRLVLRVTPHEEAAPAEVAAMQLAADAGLPVPRILGHDGDLLLMSEITGSSLIPPEPDALRLRALGAAAARIASVPVTSAAALPARTRPIALEDFEVLRRAADHVDALTREAESAVEGMPLQDQRIGLVHGDLWYGNTMWIDGQLTGILDWDCAGTGAAGIDLATLRIDAAFCYGGDAAKEVLAGWESQAGQAASDVPYWDLVAALASPPDLGWFPDAISAQGRPDLTRDLLLARRDAFIQNALSQLRS